MPKAHEPSFAILDLLDKGWNLVDRPDFFQHLENSLVGTPKERSIEGRGRAGERSARVSQ